MKVVMFYEVAPDGLSKVMAHIDGHRARLKEFHEKGVLLMAGPFANPAEGALGIFTSRKLLKNLSRAIHLLLMAC
jgi:uncharacterized protein YciI